MRSAEAIAHRMRAFEERCRAQGTPAAVQRRVILEAVLELDDHPTADEIYERMRARIPEISSTTVHRGLDTLAGLGMIGRAHHQGSAARFDAKTHRHHHLARACCRRMIAYEPPELNDLPLPEPPSGVRASDSSIQFTGLCLACGDAADGSRDEPGA